MGGRTTLFARIQQLTVRLYALLALWPEPCQDDSELVARESRLMASIASDDRMRQQSARIERSIAETRRFCEAQNALAMAAAQRALNLGGWLDVMQAVAVASHGASSAALLIALASKAAACH